MNTTVGMYAIRDRVADESGPIFEAKNNAVALRNLTDLLVQVPNHKKADFTLYQVGEYDNESMVIFVTGFPKLISENYVTEVENA